MPGCQVRSACLDPVKLGPGSPTEVNPTRLLLHALMLVLYDWCFSHVVCDVLLYVVYVCCELCIPLFAGSPVVPLVATSPGRLRVA